MRLFSTLLALAFATHTNALVAVFFVYVILETAHYGDASGICAVVLMLHDLSR